MSREIKFRAWDKLNKRMIWGPTEGSINSAWVYTLASGGSCDDIIELMQFTGLKDKNEKDIYEGDIIKGPNGKLWVIKWYRFAFCVNNFDIISEGLNKFGGNEQYLLETYLNFLPRELTVIEIVGNIYSNPELLQNK